MMSLRLALLMCFLFTFHCTAQAARVHHSHHRHAHHSKPVAIKPSKTKAAGNIKRRKHLMREYQHWKGTRYRLGANSHRAIDCSALTRRLYQGAFAVKLPRTTGEQMRRGKKARRGAPHIGDLVFFKTSKSTRHVGVYVGNNEFIHASKIKGVTVSSLANNYWQAHYETARRITDNA